MKLQKACKKVSNVADIREELHDGLIRLAGPRAWCDTRESWLARAARRFATWRAQRLLRRAAELVSNARAIAPWVGEKRNDQG